MRPPYCTVRETGVTTISPEAGVKQPTTSTVDPTRAVSYTHLVHYLSGKNTIHFRMRRPSLRKLFSSCSLGVAAFVGEISSGITTMVFNFVLLALAGNIDVYKRQGSRHDETFFIGICYQVPRVIQ